MTTPAAPCIALTVRHNQDKLPVREYLLDEEGGTLGRALANTVVLPGDANVALVHATLELIGARWVLKDIGDLVPVMHNGRPVGFGQRCDIGDGEEFSIASFQVKVSLDPKQIASIGTRLDTRIDAPTAQTLAAQSAPRLTEPLDLPSVATEPGIAAQATRPTPVRPEPVGQTAQALAATKLQRLQQDPFGEPSQQASARNFIGNDVLQLAGVMPGMERSQAEALENPMHRQANLDPLRHRSESIDALFSLKPGQGLDPLADILGDAHASSSMSGHDENDSIMAVLNQQLGGSSTQSASQSHAGTELGTALPLPKVTPSSK